jgi:hypothetical protein
MAGGNSVDLCRLLASCGGAFRCGVAEAPVSLSAVQQRLINCAHLFIVFTFHHAARVRGRCTPADTVCAAGTGGASCSPCPMGTWSAGGNSSGVRTPLCTRCPNLRTTVGEASVSAANCTGARRISQARGAEVDLPTDGRRPVTGGGVGRRLYGRARQQNLRVVAAAAATATAGPGRIRPGRGAGRGCSRFEGRASRHWLCGGRRAPRRHGRELLLRPASSATTQSACAGSGPDPKPRPLNPFPRRARVRAGQRRPQLYIVPHRVVQWWRYSLAPQSAVRGVPARADDPLCGSIWGADVPR